MSQPAASSGEGSRTITGTAPAAGPSDQGVLRLRGGEPRRRRVIWTEETVDNEGLGKKKSKICCIYHKPRAFDESSSEEESNDEESSDSDSSASEHECDHQHHKGKARTKAKSSSSTVTVEPSQVDKDNDRDTERKSNAYERT